MFPCLAYNTAIFNHGGYIRNPNGLYAKGHHQPFQLHIYGVFRVALTILLPLSHHCLVHLVFKNCTNQRLEWIVFSNLQRSEVLIGYVVKLAKLYAIVIYQRWDQNSTDVSLVDQAWPVMALSKTAISLAVIVSRLR